MLYEWSKVRLSDTSQVGMNYIKTDFVVISPIRLSVDHKPVTLKSWTLQNNKIRTGSAKFENKNTIFLTLTNGNNHNIIATTWRNTYYLSYWCHPCSCKDGISLDSSRKRMIPPQHLPLLVRLKFHLQHPVVRENYLIKANL